MPMPKVVQEAITYSVGSATSVRLTVTVGDAQAGGGSIMWGNKHKVVRNGRAVVIENNEGLDGTLSRLVMIVKDIAAGHDHTSVELLLSGSQKTEAFTFKQDAVNNNGEVIYIIIISFARG